MNEDCMSAQHTPTPWTAIDASKDRSRIEGAKARHIADLQAAFECNQEQMREDAAFIVRACNSHDDLVALLRDVVLPVVSNNLAVHGRSGCICVACELPEMIRAALAKAGAT